MALIRVLSRIINHPLNSDNKLKTISRFFKWQINSWLNPYPIIYSFANKSKLIIEKGLSSATGNMYCGLYEFEDMSFLLHFLRSTDQFIDVGANIGSYTVLGSSEVGADTIALEPVPATFKILKSNIALNEIGGKVSCLNVACGSAKGSTKFTASLGANNHVATEKEVNTIEVPVEKFDDFIQLTKPTLVKIDVEGFETEVLNGMSHSLSNEHLKAIIIELNGSGDRYGYDEMLIHDKLLQHNFHPYKYAPFEKQLVKLKTKGNHNTIYIRDIELVKKRIASAKKIKIRSKEF